MRKNIYIISIILLGLISCKNEKVNKKISPKTNALKIVDNSSNPIFAKKDYLLVYKYSQVEDTQLIGINIVDKKTIKFHLVTETLPCDTQYWGIAENKYSDLASEVDEDENGTAYGANEYIRIEKEYNVAIRLAQDLSKVNIKYMQKDSLDTDCLPITDQIMKRIK